MARHVAGKVVNLTSKGVLVKAPKMVPIGTTLQDNRAQPIGRVVDVIGPVAAPYLVVQTPRNAQVQKLLQREVYTP